MKEWLKKYWLILVILIYSLTPLLWFRDELIIAGGDESILLNPGSLFKSVFYAWNATFNAGNPVGDYQGNTAQLFPLVIFWFLLGKIGLSLVLIEKLWLISTWFMTGMGMYYLCQVVFAKNKKIKTIILLAVTLYLFNLFYMLYPLMYSVKLPVMVAPWMLAFTIKGLEKNDFKYALGFALVSLLGASSWVNPPSAMLMIFLPLLYFIFYLLTKKVIIKPFLFLLQAAFFFLLFNSYWIIPFANNLFNSVGEIKQTGSAFFFSTNSLFDPLRFLGGWFFREFSNKIEYFPLNKIYYNNYFFIIFSYLITIIAFCGYFFLKKIKENEILIYFFLLFIVGLLLVKGPQPPLEYLNSLFYKYIPGFWIFREPYNKFMSMVVLSLSIMFAYSWSEIIDFIGSKISLIYQNLAKTTLIIISVVLILLLSYPLIIGESIWHYVDGPARPYYAKIPDYWLQLADWLKQNDPDVTILTLPKTSKGSTTYDWQSGFTMKGSVAQHIIPNPYFYYQYLPIYTSEKMVKEIYDQTIGKESKFLTQDLGFFGIKYILVQKDISTDYVDGHFLSYPENMTSLLEKQENMEKVFASDKLDLWKISDKLSLPKIFSSNYPLYLSSWQNPKQIISLIEANNLAGENSLLISSLNPNLPPQDVGKVQYLPLLSKDNKISPEMGNFSFSLDTPNHYKLFFLAQNPLDINKISLDDQQLNKSSTKIMAANEGQKWLITDLGLLEKGDHKLSLNPIDQYLELKDNSFEETNQLILNKKSQSWQLIDASQDEKDDPQFSVLTINDAADGQKSLQIQAESHTAGVRQKLTLKKDKNYLLEFAYKNFDNQPFSYSIEYLTDKNNQTVGKGGFDESLPISKEWKKHQVFFSSESDQAYLYFYSRGLKQKQTVAVDKVVLGGTNIIPDSLFIKEIKENNDDLYQKLIFKKINPSKYLVEINGAAQPYYLNFMQSFDAKWQVYAKDSNGKSLAIKADHYLLNGFANSWKVYQTGDYQIIIEYQSQKWQTFFYLLSLTTVLMSIFYLLKRSIRRKNGISQSI